jgi:hypothetical protein
MWNCWVDAMLPTFMEFGHSEWGGFISLFDTLYLYVAYHITLLYMLDCSDLPSSCLVASFEICI